MNAKKYSAQPKNNRHFLYQPAGARRAETAVFATLGFLAVVSISIAVVWGSVPAGSKEDPMAGLRNLPMVKYVSSGQLAADARTLAAMVHYILESDKPAETNVVEPGPISGNLAMPTNTAPGEPRA